MEKLTASDYAQVEAERLKLKLYYQEKFKPTPIKRTLTDHKCSNCGCKIPKKSTTAYFVRGRLGASANHNPVFGAGKYFCGDCVKEGKA